MPQTIPYDPAFVLANLIDEPTLEALFAISDAQEPIDDAEEAFTNALLALRSLKMTQSELQSEGIGAPKEHQKGKGAEQVAEQVKAVEKAIGEVEADVLSRVAKLATTRVQQLPKIETAKEELRKKLKADRKANKFLESPVDYQKSEIKSMPISADSLKLDSQYFSFDSEKQTANSHAGTIASFVSSTTSFLGDSYSSQMSVAAQSQVSEQHSLHELQGTLVITCVCTHKEASLVSPLVIDPDKAVEIWNTIYNTDDQIIKTGSKQSVAQIASQSETADSKRLFILSGATYGSSFVGMVHVLKTEDTSAEQTMTSVAASLQEQMEVGAWFVSEKGGFGVDGSFAEDAKNLLSSQLISSHISLVSMGSIPSIKSNSVKIGVQQFADFDPAKMMGKLATLQNATNTDQSTVNTAAEKARTGGEMTSLRAADIKSVMSSLATIDDGKNDMLDINSLMTAFQDYVDKAIAGKVGVPINYYIHPLTRIGIAKLWMKDYFPNKYVPEKDPASNGKDKGGDGGGDGDGDGGGDNSGNDNSGDNSS